MNFLYSTHVKVNIRKNVEKSRYILSTFVRSLSSRERYRILQTFTSDDLSFIEATAVFATGTVTIDITGA